MVEIASAEALTPVAARALVEEIRGHMESARALLLRLYEGRGWQALGYASWRECVTAEFGQSQRHLYRQLDAAEIERNICPTGQIPAIPERHLRPLAPLPPEEQQAVWLDVTAQPEPVTARRVQEVVQQRQQAQMTAKPSVAGVRKEIALIDAPRAAAFSTFNRTNDKVNWAWWTWNPVTGCLHDCPYCYARDIANRFYPQKFVPTFHADRLAAPRNTPLPRDEHPCSRLVFTCSMADLFGKWVPQEWIDAVFREVLENPQWQFLFLTKFPQRLVELTWPQNAWVGTTVDRQHRVDIAEKAFRGVKAGVKWLSCEPLLEPLRFTSLEMFDLVVIGGASRSSQTEEFWPPYEWIRDLEAQARQANCKVWFKENALSSKTPVPKEMLEERQYP